VSVLQNQGATPTQIACIVRQIRGFSDLRFQAILSSADRAKAVLRSMEARCAG
jgi:hypothetical protein